MFPLTKQDIRICKWLYVVLDSIAGYVMETEIESNKSVSDASHEKSNSCVCTLLPSIQKCVRTIIRKMQTVQINIRTNVI